MIRLFNSCGSAWIRIVEEEDANLQDGSAVGRGLDWPEEKYFLAPEPTWSSLSDLIESLCVPDRVVSTWSSLSAVGERLLLSFLFPMLALIVSSSLINYK
ncbi:hypothetical protein EV1_039263 [Malus domestica]